MKKVFLSSLIASATLIASAMLPTAAAQAEPNPDVLRLCTGSPSGNYTWAGGEIASRISTSFKEIRIINTGGSLDNLRKLMANECDMAFAQSDVLDLFKMENPSSLSTLDNFRNVYSEMTHLLCPTASGWESVKDIGKAKGKIIVGPEGGGSAETWRALRSVNDDLYKNVERLAIPVNIEGASKVKDSNDTCMLWVSGVNSPDMIAANFMSVNTKDRKPAMRLVNIDDKAMHEVKGSSGQSLYKWEKISRRESAGKNDPGVYPNLIPNGWLSASVTVPSVDAVLVSRKDYKAAIANKTSRIILGIEDASPTIWKSLNPGS